MAKPAQRFPVLVAIAPIMYGPANSPRFPKELIKAMPAATEWPVRNSQGNAKPFSIATNCGPLTLLRGCAKARIVAN